MEIIDKNIDDILDSNGNNNNFITNKPYSKEFLILAKKWSKLPLYADTNSVKKFFNLLHNNQVILLISGTGSGKTVLVPKFFLKYNISMGFTGKIAITNPKILTTVNNAEFSAKTSDVILGEEIGYRYKGSPHSSSSPKTKLMYMTDGLLVATIFSGDNLLTEYQGVIIDEAHERHIQIDILLKLIKEILPVRPDFKLIIMSATINSGVFRDYFNIKNIKYGELEISGESNYQIEQNWIDPLIKINKSNYLDVSIDKCIDIINSGKEGDIIIFVPTQNDTFNGCKKLKEKCSDIKIKMKKCNKTFCIEVYAKMNNKNKELAVNKDLYKKKGFDRKIIFATNVAESSITFDGLVFVIDTGLEIANYYEVDDNSNVINKSYTSQAQIKQRIGRTGRTKAGVAYHLYSKQQYDKFKLYPEPNISVVDLSDFILQFISYSKTIRRIIPIIEDLLTVPKIEQVVYALHKLGFIKAIKFIKPNIDEIDNNNKTITHLNMNDIGWENIRSFDTLMKTINGALTSVGINILKFKSLNILQSLAIIMAKYLNCQNEIIELISIIEILDGKVNSLFEYNKEETNKFIKYFSKYIFEGSDHLTLFYIYKNYLDTKNNKFLNKKLLKNIDERIHQLHLYANSITVETYAYMNEKYNLINIKPYNDLNKNMLYILSSAYKYNLIKNHVNNIYKSLNFVQNSIASIEFSIIMPNIKTYTEYAICNSLSNIFGKKSFQCVTLIPDDIIFNLIEK